MTTLGKPRMKNFVVNQLLNCADRELKKFSSFAGAAAGGGGSVGHAFLMFKFNNCFIVDKIIKKINNLYKVHSFGLVF